MKNQKNKGYSKSNKYINIIVSLLIIIPVIYLVFVINTKKTLNKIPKSDSLSSNNFSPDSSLAKLQKTLDIAKANPNEKTLIDLSLEFYKAARYKECVGAALKALQYNPNCYAAYNNICSSYNQLGLWDEAVVAGKKALEIVPGDQLATNNLKVSMEGKAKYDKALADAISLAKSNPNEKNYIDLGNVYYNGGKFEIAISYYQKALSINNKNVLAYNNICSAYNQLGNWKLAEENCNKALAIDSTYKLAKNNLKFAKDNLKK